VCRSVVANRSSMVSLRVEDSVVPSEGHIRATRIRRKNAGCGPHVDTTGARKSGGTPIFGPYLAHVCGHISRKPEENRYLAGTHSCPYEGTSRSFTPRRTQTTCGLATRRARARDDRHA